MGGEGGERDTFMALDTKAWPTPFPEQVALPRPLASWSLVMLPVVPRGQGWAIRDLGSSPGEECVWVNGFQCALALTKLSRSVRQGRLLPSQETRGRHL